MSISCFETISEKNSYVDFLYPLKNDLLIVKIWELLDSSPCETHHHQLIHSKNTPSLSRKVMMDRLLLSTLIAVYTNNRELTGILNGHGEKRLRFSNGLVIKISSHNHLTFRIEVHKNHLYRKLYMVAPSELNLYLGVDR